MKEFDRELFQFSDDIAAAIIKYREHKVRAERMESGRVVFKGGVVVLSLLSGLLLILGILPYTRYALFPAIMLIAMTVGFYYLSQWYKKEAATAQSNGIIAEINIRELAQQQTLELRDRIFTVAGIPISIGDIDRLKPSDFE